MSNYLNHTFLSLKILALIFLLTSCSDSKIAQCQKIADLSQKISEQAQASRHTQDFDKLKETAQKFADVAQELEQLSLSDSKLDTYKKGLAQVYKSYSQSTFLMLEAIKNKDLKTAKMAKEEVKNTSRNEKNIGEELTNYCQLSG